MNNKQCVLVEFINNSKVLGIGFYSWIQKRIASEQAAECSSDVPDFSQMNSYKGQKFKIEWPVNANDAKDEIKIVPIVKQMEKILSSEGIIMQGYVVVLRDVGGKFHFKIFHFMKHCSRKLFTDWPQLQSNLRTFIRAQQT